MREMNNANETNYVGTNKMIIGIVFGVITFWLFAQSVVNVVPMMQSDLGVSTGMINIAISLSALFSGMFIVAAGGLADKLGRKKIAMIGFVLSIIGSLLLVLAQGAIFLVTARIIQGLSAAFIMPSTIALIKAYFDGPDRQRALSYWSIGSWGGSGVASFAGGQSLLPSAGDGFLLYQLPLRLSVCFYFEKPQKVNRNPVGNLLSTISD